MKKILLSAGAILAITSQMATAQVAGWHAGLTTGYYYTTIMDKGLFDSPTYDHKATFRAAPVGLAFGNQNEEGFGFQVELIRATIGQRMDINHKATPGGEYSVIGEKMIKVRYWQIPLLFKLQKGDDKVRFSFMMGPQVSFLSKSSDTETYNAATVNYDGNHTVNVTPGMEYMIGSSDENTRYNFNDLAVGAVVGIGADVFLNDDLYLSLNLRAGYNFTELREEKGGVKFADTYRNTQTLDPPSQTEDALYKRELRTAAYGGLQIGINYMFRK